MSSNVGNLEDEALRRKERLKALKRGELKTVPSDQLDQREEENILKGKQISSHYSYYKIKNISS